MKTFTYRSSHSNKVTSLTVENLEDLLESLAHIITTEEIRHIPCHFSSFNHYPLIIEAKDGINFTGRVVSEDESLDLKKQRLIDIPYLTITQTDELQALVLKRFAHCRRRHPNPAYFLNATHLKLKEGMEELYKSTTLKEHVLKHVKECINHSWGHLININLDNDKPMAELLRRMRRTTGLKQYHFKKYIGAMSIYETKKLIPTRETLKKLKEVFKNHLSDFYWLVYGQRLESLFYRVQIGQHQAQIKLLQKKIKELKALELEEFKELNPGIYNTFLKPMKVFQEHFSPLDQKMKELQKNLAPFNEKMKGLQEMSRAFTRIEKEKKKLMQEQLKKELGPNYLNHLTGHFLAKKGEDVDEKGV